MSPGPGEVPRPPRAARAGADVPDGARRVPTGGVCHPGEPPDRSPRENGVDGRRERLGNRFEPLPGVASRATTDALELQSALRHHRGPGTHVRKRPLASDPLPPGPRARRPKIRPAGARPPTPASRRASTRADPRVRARLAPPRHPSNSTPRGRTRPDSPPPPEPADHRAIHEIPLYLSNDRQKAPSPRTDPFERPQASPRCQLSNAPTQAPNEPRGAAHGLPPGTPSP